MKKTRADDADLRRFLFRATGEATDPSDLSLIDLYDNWVVELDRLAALAELLACSAGELDARLLSGAAALLKDVEERMREVLRRAAAARDS